MWPKIVLGIALCITIKASYCQDFLSESDSIQAIEHNIDSLRILSINKKNFRFTPFIAPSYSPEMQLLITAGGLLSFSLQKENPLLSRSSVPFSFGVSSNGSRQGSLKAFLYGYEDKWRLIGEFWYKDMPDHYWGVGFENAVQVPQSDSTTAYRRNWFRLYVKMVFEVRKSFYIGPILDINSTKASDLNPRMQEDPNVLRDGTDIRNSGIGVLFQYDSRDLGVNAYKGKLLEFGYTHYNEMLGGKFKFNVLDLDYRQYYSIKPRRVLAWQIRARYSDNPTPWPDLSMVGSPWDMRGYFWGRFRDNTMAYLLAEYRHMFNRKRPNKKGSYQSRSGFAVWMGQGGISPDAIRKIDWLPNLGIGFRFEVQKRMNVRIDYGIGQDSNAVYFSFNEAF